MFSERILKWAKRKNRKGRMLVTMSLREERLRDELIVFRKLLHKYFVTEFDLLLFLNR